MSTLNMWFWFALYLAAGVLTHVSLRMNLDTLLDWTAKLERLNSREEMEDFHRGMEAGARNQQLIVLFTILAWPWSLAQIWWLWRAVRRAERRAEGRPLSELTRAELIQDMIEERHDQVDAVFADEISKEEFKLFIGFAEKIAPCFGEQAQDFMNAALKYKKRSENVGALIQLRGGEAIDGEPDVLLSVIASIERAVMVASTDRRDVDVYVMLSAVSHRGLAITKTEAEALKASCAVAAEADALRDETAREYLGEYYLHGDQNEQHWHGTLQASGAEPVTDEDKQTVKDVVAFFKKVGSALDLNACQHADEELTLDATLGGEKREGPSA